MARITHVKKAQQRYATVPVLNEDGTPKRTPVMGRNGEQKTTKTGRPVFLRVTEADKSRPLPLLVCDYCREPIQIGTPYKHVTPKSGPYGGTQRNRHAGCPTWQQWDLSNSLSAQLARVSYNAQQTFTDADEVRSALTTAAEEIREIAQAKEEAAQNVEDGFGGPTVVSEELADIAQQLNDWADEVEAKADEVEDRPEELTTCPECNGEETVEDDEGNEVECEECDGSGEVENEEEISDWESQVEDWISIVDESPV